MTLKCQDERVATLKKKGFVCMYRYVCESMCVCVCVCVLDGDG